MVQFRKQFYKTFKVSLYYRGTPITGHTGRLSRHWWAESTPISRINGRILSRPDIEAAGYHGGRILKWPDSESWIWIMQIA